MSDTINDHGGTTPHRNGHRSITGRWSLPNHWAYALAASVIGLSLFASVTPSPIYHLYSERWHFSSMTLTLVYSTYAFGVLAALLVGGRVSDEVGRRPTLLVALGTLMISTVLFMLASSVAWLFVARGVQGLATGLALGAASAALLDFHPRHDSAAAGLANGVASAAGIALGILIASVLVEYSTAPSVLPYIVQLGLFSIAFVCAWLMPEPVGDRGRLHLRVERPHIPPVARRPFVLASLAVLASWSIGGLYFSLGPELGARVFDSTNVVVAASGIVALAGSAAVAQLVFGSAAPWIGASAGSAALAAGMASIVAAVALDSGAAFLVGSIISGVGFGIAFLGGLRLLMADIPVEERAAVMSAFYIVAYTALSVPAVLAGSVTSHLSVSRTFEIFGVAVTALALFVAIEAWRTRPIPKMVLLPVELRP